jgi:glycyl-tRNA synthetase beta chain
MRGSFDESFLDLPAPVITTVMKEHQGFFPVYATKKGSQPLQPAFLCVLNLQTKKEEAIRRGNERVLRARLLDAEFYYNQDRKVSLRNRTSDLMQITFHARLGSLYDKVGRLATLCERGAERLPDVAKELAVDAAWLCKSDLLAGVVREFPSLQGVMGGIYAESDGESPAVATAITEHYRPRFSGDEIPQSPLGQLLAVSDKLDTLVGFFGVGLIPSGSEDPYALRRQGLGIVQILAERRFRAFSLSKSIADAACGYANNPKFSAPTEGAVTGFLKERMASWLQSRGFRYDLIDAVLARPFDLLYDILRSVEALAEGAKEPRFEQLLTCVKRASRILPAGFSGGREAGDWKEEAERLLDQAVTAVEAAVPPHQKAGRYPAVLETLARLAGPLDHFFNKVQVNVADEALRNRRLGLLLRVRQLFDPIADFSKIVG